MALLVTYELLKAILGILGEKVTRRHYPRYLGKFWGQFWVARSCCEFSRHQSFLRNNPASQLSLSSQTGDQVHIYRCSWPRQLTVCPLYFLDHLSKDKNERNWATQLISEDSRKWIAIAEGSGNEEYLVTAKYLAVSYRRAAFSHKRPTSDTWRKTSERRAMNANFMRIGSMSTALAQLGPRKIMEPELSNPRRERFY